MAIATGKCPSCGASIEFRAGASIALVCPYCNHVVVRADRAGADALRSLGRAADVTFGDVSFAPGTRGVLGGRSFEIRGRQVWQHPMGGTWEEYYAVFDDGRPGWISEAQGRWAITERVDADFIPSWDDLSVQMRTPLAAAGEFVVVEKSEGTFLGAEGELPFAFAPNATRRFIDLSGPGGAWATIDYEDGESILFVGRETTLAELNAAGPAGAPAPIDEVKTADIKCPACGAPQPLLAPDKTEHVGCRYCGAIFELETQRIVHAAQLARSKPRIALGREGSLHGVRYTVIGFMERSGTIDGDSVRWSEYLLYAAGEGFRWLIEDEGAWSFGVPIGAGDVTVDGAGARVSYGGKEYDRRNSNPATVESVLGEFYWKVQIGETVDACDYTYNTEVVSSETTGTEVSWTHSTAIGPGTMRTEFDPRDGGSSKDEGGGGGGGDYDSGGGSSAKTLLLILGVLFFLFFAALGTCEGGGSGGGGGWGGGSGGKPCSPQSSPPFGISTDIKSKFP
ncbi:MAG: DUF4178 domain-containing protein [Polyangiales bacterium]